MVLRVVREDGSPVEGAIVLRKVEPALETVRAEPSDTDPNHMSGGVAQTARLHQHLGPDLKFCTGLKPLKGG